MIYELLWLELQMGQGRNQKWEHVPTFLSPDIEAQ